MKRILSLVLAMVMVLGSFGAVFAEDTTLAEEAVEILMDLEVLKEGKLEQDLKRQDAIVLLSRLFGDEETAKDFPAEDLTFEDIADPFYEGYIAWAVAQELTDGKSETKFGFDDKLKTQELAMFLLRALGYGDVDFDDALAEAKELGLLENVADEKIVKRGDMALMTVNALETPMKDSEITLAEHLELVMPEEPAPAALEVEEVVADNLKSFKVVFNQAVESAEVAVKGNTVTLKLAEDKMSAVGSYGTVLSQSASVEFTINAETEAGLEIEDLVVTKVVTDTTVPAVLGAKALNAKQIELLFSEPVQLNEPNAKLLNDIKVDDKAIVAEASINYLDNKVILTLLAPMAEGTRKLEVGKVKDFANFLAPTATFDITVVKDETAPVAISAEIENNSSIVVTFDEPLSKAALGTYTVDGVAPASVAFVTDTNYTQVRLTLGSPLSIGAVVEVKVGYKGQKDIMGNEVKETTYITTKVADDTTLPTVELTSVGKGNKLTLTFSKSMTQTGQYQILDKDGKEVGSKVNIPAFKGNTNNTVLEITGALGLVDPAQYSIRLTDMKDASIRVNPLGTTTLAFNSVDTKIPTVDATYKFVPATEKNANDKYENKITIYFSEAMDKDSLENLANYMLGGNTPLHVKSEYTKATAAADNKSVTITYVTDASGATHATAITVLSAVTDIAKNPVVSTVVNLHSAVPFVISSAEVIALNKVKVTFNTNVGTVYPSLFSINDENNYFVSAAVADNVVTFTTARDLKSGVSYLLTVVDTSLIVDKFGDKLDYPDLTLKVNADDKVAPTFKVAKIDDTKVKFTFSKEVQGVSLTNLNNQLAVRKGGVVTSTNVVNAVYSVDANGNEITVANGTTFILYLSVDKANEIGFPLSASHIKDTTLQENELKATDWLEIK